MIVLDTSAWIWWVSDPGRLSNRARSILAAEEKEEGLVLSAISIWEVALKCEIGKLELDRDLRSWITLATAYPGIRITPLGRDEALESVLLPGSFDCDPADRFIVALARRLGAAVLTSDRKIRRYRHVETIW